MSGEDGEENGQDFLLLKKFLFINIFKYQTYYLVNSGDSNLSDKSVE